MRLKFQATLELDELLRHGSPFPDPDPELENFIQSSTCVFSRASAGRISPRFCGALWAGVIPSVVLMILLASSLLQPVMHQLPGWTRLALEAWSPPAPTRAVAENSAREAERGALLPHRDYLPDEARPAVYYPPELPLMLVRVSNEWLPEAATETVEDSGAQPIFKLPSAKAHSRPSSSPPPPPETRLAEAAEAPEAALEPFPSPMKSPPSRDNSPTEDAGRADPAPEASPPSSQAANPDKPGENKNKVVQTLLQKCEQHFAAMRLLYGREGNARQCYREVLKLEPDNFQAHSGLRGIRERYEYWLEQALQNGEQQKARRYLKGFQLIAPDSPKLVEFQRRVENLTPPPPAAPRRGPRATPRPVEPSPRTAPPSRRAETHPPPEGCPHCNCEELLGQLSLGITPLTRAEKNFLKSGCR